MGRDPPSNAGARGWFRPVAILLGAALLLVGLVLALQQRWVPDAPPANTGSSSGSRTLPRPLAAGSAPSQALGKAGEPHQYLSAGRRVPPGSSGSGGIMAATADSAGGLARVVVVGGGLAGLAAAIEAAEAMAAAGPAGGGEVVVVEKMPKLGGNSMKVRGRGGEPGGACVCSWVWLLFRRGAGGGG